MIAKVVLPLLILTAVYGLVILGLVLLLHKLGFSERVALVLAFLTFGVVTGLLAAWVWPVDSSLYLNWPGVLGGDWLYDLSIRTLGDPSSPQAHGTIPWPLRIPQVYVLVSTTLWGLASLPFLWAYNRRT